MNQFDLALKRRAVREEYRLPEGFDRRLDDVLERLPERGRAGRARPVRGVLAAAALCAILAVSTMALALSPTLREALSGVLGDFIAYAQTVEGVTAVDQGIELRVVSAIADSTTVKVYAEVRDLTGDRITGPNLNPFGVIKRETPDENYFTFGRRCVGYDPETKTVLLEFVRIGSNASEATDLVLNVRELQPGYNRIYSDTPIPTDALTGETLESMTLETGETVLKPGQTEMELGAEYVALSSMGFASDGDLHLLFRYDGGVIAERSYVGTNVWGPDGTLCMFTRQPVDFTVDGVSYHDWSFEADRADAGAITIDGVYGLAVTDALIEGEWTLPLTVEVLPERTISLEGNMVGTVTLEELRISALGIRIIGDSPLGDTLAYSFTVFLTDGTVLHPDSNGGGGWGMTAHRICRDFEFENPVDIDRVTGIAIGQWYIPIGGDTAGQGCWLKEQP